MTDPQSGTVRMAGLERVVARDQAAVEAEVEVVDLDEGAMLTLTLPVPTGRWLSAWDSDGGSSIRGELVISSRVVYILSTVRPSLSLRW